jgi:hypothetical protein
MLLKVQNKDDEMQRDCYTNGRMGNHSLDWRPDGIYQLENLGSDGKIILK